jgi:C4-type Zn-finger protein
LKLQRIIDREKQKKKKSFSTRMTHFATRNPVAQEKMVVRKQCRACSQLGVSRALATMLPAVHNEVFLLRFKCDHCGFAQCEIKRDGEKSPC